MKRLVRIEQSIKRCDRRLENQSEIRLGWTHTVVSAGHATGPLSREARLRSHVAAATMTIRFATGWRVVPPVTLSVTHGRFSGRPDESANSGEIWTRRDGRPET